jgi:hypothetical protein
MDIHPYDKGLLQLQAVSGATALLNASSCFPTHIPVAITPRLEGERLSIRHRDNVVTAHGSGRTGFPFSRRIMFLDVHIQGGFHFGANQRLSSPDAFN